MRSDMKIAFIGGGNMASALLGGLAGKLTAGCNIHVVDPNADALARLKERFGVSTAAGVDAAVYEVDVIVLAVKCATWRRRCCRICAGNWCCRSPPEYARWICRAGLAVTTPSCAACPIHRP